MDDLQDRRTRRRQEDCEWFKSGGSTDRYGGVGHAEEWGVRVSRLPGPLAEQYGGRALVARDGRNARLAEAVRDDKLEPMDRSQRLMACNPDAPWSCAGFWLVNQARSGEELGAFLVRVRELYTQVGVASSALHKLQSRGEDELVAEWRTRLDETDAQLHDLMGEYFPDQISERTP